MSNYLYGFSVYSIQEYIFATNELTEVIGASEIVERVCTTDFNEHFNAFSPKIILQAAGNVRCQFSINDEEEHDTFKEAYANYTKKISLAYPTLKFAQGIYKTDASDKNAILKLDKRIESKRNLGPYYVPTAPMLANRSQRTGLMGAAKEEDISTEKKKEFKDGEELKAKIKTTYGYPALLSDIVDKNSFFALIHIDANGLGDIFKGLSIDMVKDLSETIEAATQKSLTYALEQCFGKTDDKDYEIPFRPVIIGGDDITVIINAQQAIQFTHLYLKKFECETQTIDGLPYGLKACAGIAFTKEKFPLHYTADLVEDLCKNAKDKGRTISSAKIHRVRNTFARDFDAIVESEYTLPDGTSVDQVFDICQLEKFQDHLKLLNQKDFPANDLRRYLDLVLSNNPQRTILWNRINSKCPDKYKDIIGKDSPNIKEIFHLINLKNFASV